MVNKIYQLSDEDFTKLIRGCLNTSEVLFKLGYTVNGNSWAFSTVRRRMSDLGLSVKDFRGREAIVEHIETTKVKPENLFYNGSKHNRVTIRRYIMAHNLLPYKCAICGTTKWQGKTLSLELDHINGINNDNRLENLRFLCPNCHSQTSTYGAKNHQPTESHYEVSKELTKLIVKEYVKTHSMKKVAYKYGIHLNAVKQVIKDEGFTRSNQWYVIVKNSEGKEVNRFGCIAECCRWLMDNDMVSTKQYKNCRNTFNSHVRKNTPIKGLYFTLLDA